MMSRVESATLNNVEVTLSECRSDDGRKDAASPNTPLNPFEEDCEEIATSDTPVDAAVAEDTTDYGVAKRQETPMFERIRRFKSIFNRPVKLESVENEAEDKIPDEANEIATTSIQDENRTEQSKAAKATPKAEEKKTDSTRKARGTVWDSVLTVVLVEGENVRVLDQDGVSDVYTRLPNPSAFVKFKLGAEKYKSKPISKTCQPSWREQFVLHLFPETSTVLELTVWDADRMKQKEGYIGKSSLDVGSLEREKTHSVELSLEEGTGKLFLLITISGLSQDGVISDLSSYSDLPKLELEIRKRYSFLRTLLNIHDVGQLLVKVFRAQGLTARDLGGRPDPFCVLELVNFRLQTHTEYRTLNPCWNKIFIMQVRDIHDCLDITVYDENKDGRFDFLGRLLIPLLRIRNKEKRWYALKDKKLRRRAKGSNPQILMEMTLIYNPVRAAIRTFQPKEAKYVQSETRFKRQIFLRNVARVRSFAPIFINANRFIKSCFEWESAARSTLAMVTFIFTVYFFEPYMLPVPLLLIYLKQYTVSNISCVFLLNLLQVWSVLGLLRPRDELFDDCDDDDEDADDDKEKDEKKTLKDRFQAIQDITQMVQEGLGYAASLGESLINAVNFTVPFLSYLAMLVLLLAVVILYYVPLRYLIMMWGIKKFTKKLLKPRSVSTNEFLNFLCRVPDKEHLITYRDLRPTPLTDIEKRETRIKKTSSTLI